MQHHFPLYEFKGAPYELGRAQGETLAEPVRRQVLDTLKVAALAGLDRVAALDWATEQLPRMERLGPHLVDELRGLSDGAGITLAEAIAIQVRPGPGRMIGGCTAVAAGADTTIDGRPLAAHNRDLFAGFRERMVVTLLRPAGGTPLLMHSVPGELGGIGLNGHGLTLFANSLWPRTGRTWMGTPVLRRLLLEATNADEATECARSMAGPAIGSFLLIDAAGHMRNLEIMPERVTVIARDGGVFAHTNHCLDPQQQSCETQPLPMPGSPARCRTIQTSLENATGRIDVAELKRQLAQHAPAEEPICRHAQGAGQYETAATSVVEPVARRLHLSYGPPCEGRFATFTV